MIIRILGEGQIEVPNGVVIELNELDAVVESAVAAGDEAAFAEALACLIERVQTCGAPLPDDMVLPSDAILPPPDSTITEVRALLREDGLIPG